MSLNGIDISSWQTGIDLASVPCDFVICKATGGTGYVNPDCDRAYQQAKSLNKKLGVYHFARESGYEGSAIEEADFFLKNIEGYIGEAILVLDFEGNAVQLGPSWALEFLNRIYEKTGVKPFFYTYNNAVNSYDWSEVASLYPLWNAGYYNYGTTFYDYNPNAPLIGGTGAWFSATMYQYTSEGRLGSWNGNLDLNVFYGNTSDWDKYAKREEDNMARVPVDGANVQIYEVNYTGAQLWWKRDNGDGTVSFRNVSCYKWLSIYNGANIENGSNACVWEGTTEEHGDKDDPRAAQKFVLVPAKNHPEAYNILYADNQNYALDVDSASTEDYANVQAYEVNDTSAQEWYIYELPDGCLQIINAYSWKALDVYAGGYEEVPDVLSLSNVPNVAASLMEHLCEHNWHGYTQGSGRWGDGEGVCVVRVDDVDYEVEQGDRDCSSAVISAYQSALKGTAYEGVLDAATYTGNMRSVFVNSGLFEWHPMWDGFIAQRGDIYLNEVSHTAMCTSAIPDMLAEFNINEFGGITGGATGDQTGAESRIAPYYNFPWDGILAWIGG